MLHSCHKLSTMKFRKSVKLCASVSNYFTLHSEDTGVATTHTSSGVVNLSGTNYLNINIDTFPTGMRVIITNPLVVEFREINFFGALE